MSDLRNNSQFRLKIPVQLRVIWFPCSPEIYMYSAYQLDYWQVGRITQFEVTCFSRCSIQCHIALEEGGYCFVGWMRNFLAAPFPDLAAHLFTLLLFFFMMPPHGKTKWSNVNVLQSDNGFKRRLLEAEAGPTTSDATYCPFFCCVLLLTRHVVEVTIWNEFPGVATGPGGTSCMVPVWLQREL